MFNIEMASLLAPIVKKQAKKVQKQAEKEMAKQTAKTSNEIKAEQTQHKIEQMKKDRKAKGMYT